MDYIHFYDSPIGKLTIGSDGTNIIGLWFDGGRYYEDTIRKERTIKNDLPVFHEADRWLDIYFAGHNPDFLPPLLVRKSAFCKKICDLLLEIPYGTTCTYGDIAKRLEREEGRRMSAQAVGGAVGRNPVCILIPCHRVIGSDGNLTGYGGGIQNKIKLLQYEGIDTSRFTLPTP